MRLLNVIPNMRGYDCEFPNVQPVRVNEDPERT